MGSSAFLDCTNHLAVSCCAIIWITSSPSIPLVKQFLFALHQNSAVNWTSRLKVEGARKEHGKLLTTACLFIIDGLGGAFLPDAYSIFVLAFN